MIQNKTEINNSDTTRYTPCGPWIFSADYFNRWQVVWRYSVYDLVVQHQPFNYQANVYTSVITGSFSIEITEGNDICEILELVPDPTIENGYTYHVVSDTLENVTLADAGGGIADSLLMDIQGVPSAHHAGFIRYTIHFTGTGDVTYNITENGETISYHTRVVEPTFYMDYDTVYVKHGEYAEVYYKPKPVDCQGMWDYWNGGYPGPNTLYSSNILGGQENIIFGLTNTDGNIGWLEYGSSFTNYDKKEQTLLVWADGKEPIDSTLTSTIHISSNKSVIPEVDIPVRVYHNNEYPLGIFFDPPVLAPGDTANIILMRRVEEYGEFIEGEANYEQLPPDQEFEIFIEGGDEYALLYSSVQNITGTEFTGTNSFKLIANEDVFNSELVTIKAYTTIIGEDIGDIGVSSAGLSNRKLNKAKRKEKKNSNTIDFAFENNTTRDIVGLGYVVVGHDSLDHFEITIIPDTLASKDTLAFTELASLKVLAMDADSSLIQLDSTKLLRFEVTTNTDYGTFIKPNGDTLVTQSTEPVILENITYADAKNGKVKFAAIKENPDSIVKCNIKVTLQEDTTKIGEREAVVLEQTLTIVMDGEHEVEPIITGRTYDTEHDTYLNAINDNNRKQFKVSLTRGGKRIKKHAIRLRTNYIDSTGGHDHKTPRRPDSAFTYQRRINGVLTTINVPTERARRQNYGSFYSYSSGETFNTDSLKGMLYERAKQDTNDLFEYVASIWGDTMKVYLQSMENGLLKDSVSIVERIPDLVQLDASSDYYELVGSPLNNTNTNDPCRAPESLTSLHNINHFGTQALVDSVISIASRFHSLYPGYRLRINDMSLEKGGKFDVSNSWRGSHGTHRLGENADIPYSIINSENNCIDLNTEEYRVVKIELEGIIMAKTSRRPYTNHDPDNHYHIYVYNRGEENE